VLLDGVAEDGGYNTTILPGEQDVLDVPVGAQGHGQGGMSLCDGTLDPIDPNKDPKHPTGDPEKDLEDPSIHSITLTPSHTLTTPLRILKSCYICKCQYNSLHHFYDSLCPQCAALNWTKRIQLCDMRNRVCLVTGGRVKIGFQCCLKLLRCGAIVISTSRFPVDAAKRFAAQGDFMLWRDRLHIYGLDLRDLAHLESFCESINSTYTHLDVIINNACQTIRRPVAYYAHMIEAERVVLDAIGSGHGM